MNKDNIQSGEDYAKVLIDIIVEGELDLSQEQKYYKYMKNIISTQLKLTSRGIT